MIFNQRIGGAGGASASILAYGDALQSTDTVYAEKDGKRVNGVWKQVANPDFHGLPAEYQEVEWLYSDGAQYIDTNIVPEQLTDPEFYAEIYSLGNRAYSGKFTSNESMIWFGLYDDGPYLTADFNLRFVDGYLETGRFAKSAWHNVYMRSGLQMCDTERLGERVSDFSKATSLSFYLFTRNGVGTGGNEQRIRKFWIKSAGQFAIDFVPCYRKSDSKPGMYDTVNDVFYVNQGTGADFLVGAAVPQYKPGFEIAPIREYGTWVLTATHGGSTKTINVLVDAAEVFAVEVTA